jgi:SAM-dependent methyltransferase
MKTGICNLCGSLVVQVNKSYFGTRCVNCRSTQIHRAVGFVIESLSVPTTFTYELSSRGALHKYLKTKVENFYYSEYFDDVPLGLMKNSVVCQDVQNLLLNKESFDLVTSTEVFEHVPDDIRGFSEIYRVLKNNGYFIFTVPFSDIPATIERCYLQPDGTIKHNLEPEYHGDQIRGQQRVLTFRNYGLDIIQRLSNCGFLAEIHTVNSKRNVINDQKVVIAKKLSP